MPVAERSAALRAAVIAWEPFPDAEFRIALSGSRGIAFAWDRAGLSQMTEAVGIDASAADVWPETLVRTPQVSGLRLVQGQDGFEAECWADACLIASRWWPRQPGADEWQSFVRSLGAAAPADADGMTVPVAQTLETVARPWVPVRRLTDVEGGVSRGELLGWRAVILCCIAVSAASARQLWSAHERVDALKAELATVQAASSGTVAARDRALQLMAESRQLSGALGGVLPLELMQHLVQVLPKDVLVREVELEGSRLRLGLDTPASLARSALIKLLQDGNWLRDVREVKSSSSSGNTVLEMRIDGLTPPLAPAAAASGPPSEPKPGAGRSPFEIRP